MTTMQLDPTDEAQRLAAVRRYEILDSPPDGAFDRVCAIAARAFGTPIATVTIVDEDRIWFKALQGIDAKEIPREPGLCASAILQGDSYVVEDAASDPRTMANGLVEGGGVRFYAAAPIVTHDGFRLGTVNVLDTRVRQASEEQLQTLHDLAALVMDQIELRLAALRQLALERQLSRRDRDERTRFERLATTLQRSLSPPRLPEIEGVGLDVLYEPFTDDVAGDFYDVFALGGGEWGVFLGDVCGKGASAASRTSLARYTLRSAAVSDGDPARVVASLNAALLMESDVPMCSVIYGCMRVLPTSQEIEISLVVGGHPPPLVLRADGSVELVQPGGPMPGVVRAATYATKAVTLRAADLLVLYSDGITDAAIDGTMLGEDGLVDALTQARAEVPGENPLDAIRRLLARADRPLRDDVAMLAIGPAPS